MKLPEEEAFNSIITAVQAQRTDVLKAVLDTIIKSKHLLPFVIVLLIVVISTPMLIMDLFLPVIL